MLLQLSATVHEGQLVLDKPLTLPDASRVIVTLEIQTQNQDEYLKRLDEWSQFVKEHPVRSGGERCTREQLHEREI